MATKKKKTLQKTPRKKAVSRKSAQSDACASVRGMQDILPKDGHLWQEVIRKGFEVSDLHDFYYTETPPIEKMEIYSFLEDKERDFELKRLYAFSLKGQGKMILRPGGRIPLLRSYHEHHLGYFSSPLKTFSFGAMVRRPTSRSQHSHEMHEWGFNIIGEASDPFYDVSVLGVTLQFLRNLKISDVSVAVNMGGCRTCREQYRHKLRSHYNSHKKKLCNSCSKLYEKRTFKCFRCLQEKCQEIKASAPIILDYLCQSCNNHFKTLLELFEDNGLVYEPDPYLFNDFEGCNKAAISVRLKTGEEIARGGRYDYLMESLCGRQVPVVGMSVNLDLVVSLMKERGTKVRKLEKVFFIAVGEKAKKRSIKLINMLRECNIGVAESIGKKSLKAQLKAAEKSRVKVAVIVGQKEVFEETAIIRNLETGAQESVVLDKLLERVRRNLKKS